MTTKTTNAQLIWDLINSGWKVTSKQIAGNTDMTYGTASSTMSKMHQAGLIDVVGIAGKGRSQCNQYQVVVKHMNKEWSEVYELFKGVYKRFKKSPYKKHKQRKKKPKKPKNFEYTQLVGEFIEMIGYTPRKLSIYNIKKAFNEAIKSFE